MKRWALGFVTAVVLIVCGGGLQPAGADTSTNGPYTFTSFPDPVPTGTGLGTLDVILFEHGSGGASNTCCSTVNVDDANGELPTGSGPTADDSGNQFWMTSIGDLRTYYASQFPSLTSIEIVLFLDINQDGGVGNPVNVNTLTIIKNATTTPTALNPTGVNDLSSADQESITGYTGGTVLTSLATTQTLNQINTGAGIPDWVIFTTINPFDPSFSATDTLLFFFRISGLDDGGEAVNISGTFAGCEVTPQGCGGGVPGPATLLLFGSGLLGLGLARRLRGLGARSRERVPEPPVQSLLL